MRVPVKTSQRLGKGGMVCNSGEACASFRSVLCASFLKAQVYSFRDRLQFHLSISAISGLVFAVDVKALPRGSRLKLGDVVRSEVAPRLSLLAMLILFHRAVAGPSGLDTSITAKKLGLRELAFGAITVLSVATGFLFHW